MDEAAAACRGDPELVRIPGIADTSSHCRHCTAGNATAKAVQAFVLGGFPEAAVAKLTGDSMPTFMAADGGTAPRVRYAKSSTL